MAFLSESEAELILDVLQRDQVLRQLEEQRVKRLKAELLDIRRRGAKRVTEKYTNHSCARCQQPLPRFSTRADHQCPSCKHQVCRTCRSIHTTGSWQCSVCAKEAELKKSTGDWFYDQRINRYCNSPGHANIRLSLRKQQQMKKRETAGEVLLRSNQNSPAPAPHLKPPPHPHSSEADAVDRVSFSSRVDTESLHSAASDHRPPVQEVRGSSPAGSVQLKGSTKSHSSTTSSAGVETSSLIHHINVCNESLKDADGLFKKSVRKVHKLSDLTKSVMDLRDGEADSATTLGDRSKSVPGLNVDEDEEEDIDNLVNIHRQTMAASMRSDSRSTMGSMMSVYSEAGDYDVVDVSGEILFALRYDDATPSLSVLVRGCRDLSYADAAKKKCNPYVKTYLLPDRSRQSKKKTSSITGTINPHFNQTLKYSISRSQLMLRTLQLSVWHHDRFGRNAFLGEVEVPLDCQDLDSGHEQCVALRAKDSSAVARSPFSQYKGELGISIKYVTGKNRSSEKGRGKKAEVQDGGELHVLIKEAHNLCAMKPGGTSDSFVKGYLLPSTAKNSKRKTPVVKKSVNPHYDHTFVYSGVSLEQLKVMSLELTVWDREALSSNDFLGGVRLSLGAGRMTDGGQDAMAESTADEACLWQKMMQYPDAWAEGTLPLRSSMGKGK